MLLCRTWPLLSLHEESEFDKDVLWCLSGRREALCHGCHMMLQGQGKG